MAGVCPQSTQKTAERDLDFCFRVQWRQWPRLTPETGWRSGGNLDHHQYWRQMKTITVWCTREWLNNMTLYHLYYHRLLCCWCVVCIFITILPKLVLFAWILGKVPVDAWVWTWVLQIIITQMKAQYIKIMISAHPLCNSQLESVREIIVTWNDFWNYS